MNWSIAGVAGVASLAGMLLERISSATSYPHSVLVFGVMIFCTPYQRFALSAVAKSFCVVAKTLDVEIVLPNVSVVQLTLLVSGLATMQ